MKTKTVEISPLQLGLGALAVYFLVKKPASAAPTAAETAANAAASASRVLSGWGDGTRRA